MSNSPFKPEDSGLLLVFMQPGPQVSLEEFHEWYDTEHVPLRIHRFPTFRSAVRYSVSSSSFHPPGDGIESSWGAFYTVSSNSTFADPSYTSLRSERSSREAELFTRLAIVDRRIYKLEYDSDSDPTIDSPKKIGLGVQKGSDAPIYLVTNSVTMKESAQEEYNRWFDEEHAPMLSKIPGWRRSRRFRLVDNGVNGRESKEGDAERVPKCLGLHEYDIPNPEDTPEYAAACSTEWRSKVLGEKGENLVRRERKVCRLYRGWDPIAALEAEKKA